MCRRRLTTILVAGAALAASGAAGRAATQGRVVQYARQAVTVRVARVPAAEILAELGRQAGAEVRGELAELGDVSAEFEAVPLSAALHRLLGEQSFALIYGPDGELRAINVLPASDATGPKPIASPPPPTLPPTGEPANPVARWREMFAEHPAVRVSGKLALALGGAKVSFKDLMSAMIQNDDPEVRSDALRVGMHLLATDSGMRAVLLGVWGTLSDSEMARVRTVTGGPSWRRLLVFAARTQL